MSRRAAPTLRLGGLVAASFVVLCIQGSSASAGPPPQESPGGPVQVQPDPSSDGVESESTDWAGRRAAQIQQLIDGTLDPAVDERALFRVSVQLAVELAAEPREGETVPADGPGPVLVDAYRSWLALAPEARAQALQGHIEKRETFTQELAGEQRRREATDRVRAKVRVLTDLLAGELDPAHDPQRDLTVDLLDPYDSGLGGAGDVDEELALALEELAEARRTVASLESEELEVLLAAHERAGSEPTVLEPDPEVQEREERQRELEALEVEAQAAAAAQEAALEEARQAKSEVKRQLAEEEARLQGIKQEFAIIEGELNEEESSLVTWEELSLEWSRRVRELADSPLYGSERAAQADPMYEELRGDLGQTRDALRSSLATVRNGLELSEVGSGLSARASEVESAETRELRDELEETRRDLMDRGAADAWERAQDLRDHVVDMNRARLELLALASPSLRASVTGFGRQGVDQVKRELDQISLELSFHALKVRELRRDIGVRAREATIPLLLGSLKFLLLAFGFWIWRRNAPRLLEHARSWVHTPTSRPARWRASLGSVLWFAEQIRKPVEVLFALWLGLQFVGPLDRLPELALLWIVARWTLIGLAIILFVDAVAAREAQFSTEQIDTSALRISSLRLVGLSIISVGLVLSLTAAMVGKGAIYRWVLSTCWILVLPIAALLIARWRTTVFQRLATLAEPNALTRWAAGRDSGVVSIPAAALGAAYLLGTGVVGWSMRQLAGLESTRHLLAYMFRREVARQAANQLEGVDLAPADPALLGPFDPEMELRGSQLDFSSRLIDQVATLASVPRSTLSAIVGERGAGKSTFLRSVSERLERQVALSCPEAGFDALVQSLARALDVGSEDLETELRRRGPTVILIDDMHRLIVPAVGGLHGLDEFASFARRVGGQVSWVAGFESAAWSYIRRARGERVFFEQVITLPRWSEEQLADLIDSRLQLAAITVSYEELSMPRQPEAPLPHRADRSRAAYMRLLWDYSDGNPGATLDAFRRSLFVEADGEITVRLFREPDSEVIEGLSLSVLFVLRACVQLERARIDEIVDATQLDEAEVADALRFCVSRDYLSVDGGLYRLSWAWYRTISTVLVRQHLLPRL